MGNPPSSGRSIDEQISALSGYPAMVKRAIIEAEDRLIDVIAQVHSNQSRVRELKRGATAEINDGDQGRSWYVEVGQSATRSYNTQSLLAKLTPPDGSIASTLQFLLTSGVIDIKWNWTPLKKLARRERLQLAIAQHEIADGDPEYDIGEYWKQGYPTYKPIEETE